MSVEITTELWQGSSELSGTKLLIMLALADWADEERTCFPKVKSISKRIRVDERGTRKHIKELREMGYIEVLHQSDGRLSGGRRSNLYKIHTNPSNPVNTTRVKRPGSNNQGRSTRGSLSPETPTPTIYKEPSVEPSDNTPIVPTGTDTQFWQQVQDLYNEVCPKLKVCRVVNDKRKKLINLRGKECNHDLDVFRQVFKYYNQSPHHIGQNNRNWIADIEFVLREEPFAKGQEEAPLTQQQIVEQQNQEALNMYIGGPPPPQPITDEDRKWWEEVTPING